MPIYCISDLHLGDRGPRDNFCSQPGREESLVAFCRMVQEQDGQLLILGDLFDWWQCNLSHSVLAYRSLLEKMLGWRWRHKPLWVVGNHDSALKGFIGWAECYSLFSTKLPKMESSFTWQFGSRKVLFLHGHEADPYCNSQNPGIGEISAIVSGLLEDRASGKGETGFSEPRLLDTLARVSVIWRSLTFQRDRRAEVLYGLQRIRQERGADVVVCGHTHEPVLIDGTYANCGCWCEERNTFIKVEDNGQVGLHEWLLDGTSRSLTEEAR